MVTKQDRELTEYLKEREDQDNGSAIAGKEDVFNVSQKKEFDIIKFYKNLSVAFKNKSTYCSNKAKEMLRKTK